MISKALVLVRNLQSGKKVLDFGDFSITVVGLRFRELQEIFSSEDVYQSDWIFEKSYSNLPPGPLGSPVGVGGIPNDIEDTLLLLRLYKAGDIAFVRQAVIPPNGGKLLQFPYRVMNTLNSNSALVFEFNEGDCESWKAFASAIRASESWNSDWFAVARRFFLYAGAKEFSPKWDDVDRVVDYATALEATVVPERDFSKRRMSRRAAVLVSPTDPAEQKAVTKLVKQLYDIRSSIVHGSRLSDKTREWLYENCGEVELRVRQVLVAAVQKLPSSEEKRHTMLAALYDPTDEDCGAYTLQTFHSIKTTEVRKAIATQIARLVRD